MASCRVFAQFLMLAVLLSCIQAQSENHKVILDGQVIDRDSKSIILMKTTEDARYQGVKIAISANGHFTHEMQKPQFLEEFALIFEDEFEQGRWRPIQFFPESDTIRFTLYPISSFEKNKVFASELRARMQEFESDLMNNFESPFRILYARMNSLGGSPDDPELEVTKNKIDSLGKVANEWQLERFENKPDLFSYIRLLELIKLSEQNQIPMQRLEEALKVFTSKYPDHPYTNIAKNLQNGFHHLKVGGKYIDFAAIDSLGREVQMSKLLEKDKMTLLDLWAPWCAPCINKSKKLREKFHDIHPMGLEVIAVVGGIADEQQYFNAMRKYNYPWNVLMELQAKNGIWEKYNLNNAGGGQFLLNQNGEILAINPELAELVAIVERSN